MDAGERIVFLDTRGDDAWRTADAQPSKAETVSQSTM